MAVLGDQAQPLHAYATLSAGYGTSQFGNGAANVACIFDLTFQFGSWWNVDKPWDIQGPHNDPYSAPRFCYPNQFPQSPVSI